MNAYERKEPKEHLDKQDRLSKAMRSKGPFKYYEINILAF